jgi:hypothetical protein
MPFVHSNCDCSPLVIDTEFDIRDEDLVAEYVGRIVLGHYSHVKRIINTLSTIKPAIDNENFEFAISRLKKDGKSDTEIEKRDGWVFQIISWLSLLVENNDKKFFCQQPHDAPAQHGLDGVAVLLGGDLTLESIVITEDKCTVKHRTVIPEIWKEFEEFELGIHNNQLISRISAMLENLDSGDVLEANKNDIYKKDLWRYRVGINRNSIYQDNNKRKKLFKGYDDCVTGLKPHRRYASTILKEDIRGWMQQFCEKVIQFLENEKKANV